MESKKKRIMVFGIFALAVLLIVGGTTYAFFFTNGFGQTKNETVTMKAGTLNLEFSDLEGASLKIEKTLWFGDTVEKTFQIKNTGTLDAYAKISWDNLVNTYLPQSLSYTLQYKTSEDGEYQDAKTSRKNVPTSESSNRVLADSLLIPAGETYYYLLTIKLEDLPTIDQTQDLKAIFSTKFILDEGKIPSTSVMMRRQDSDSTETIWGYSADIKRIVFEDTMNPKTNATYTYDISESQDESVMSYLIPTEEDDTKYTLYIQGEHGVVANRNSSYLFRNFTNLESIKGLEYFDTSNVTNMGTMFSGCSSLTSIDVSNFYTSNVTTMNSMFYNCSKLTSLDVSKFDTSKVTNMRYMFSGCNNLISLDVSNFDTGNVTNMDSMFTNCSNLTSIDVSNFSTSNVTNMDFMFSSCSSLTSLDVSNFDTSKVSNMNYMFQGCSNLTLLDLSNFDISSVSNNTHNILSSVSAKIKITVHNDELKQWVIDASTSPKLADSNFIVKA